MEFIKQRSLLNACVALSLSTFLTQAYGETVVVQAEQFNNSGGTFNDGQPNPISIYSVNGQGAINWINNGDYVDYDINTNGGEYTIEYLVGTSIASNANIELFTNTNNAWVSQGTVAVPLGSWDDFQPLTHSSTVTLPAGSSTIRIQAVGANWQWNLESFSLVADDIDTGGGTGEIIVQLENFAGTGTNGRVGGDTVEGFGQTATGVNWVTNGDYGDYNVTFDQAGIYKAFFTYSALSAGSYGARIDLNSAPVAWGYFAETGSWNVSAEVELYGGEFVVENAGSHVLRVEAIGGSDWQWSGDNVRIVRVGNVTSIPTPLYNPNDHSVAEIEGPVLGLPFLKQPVQIPVANQVLKSDVWYTYPQNNQLAGFDNFGATGAFWGHPPEENFYDETTIVDWTELVRGYQDIGIEYTARGEFDWGFRWFTEYVTNSSPHYVRTLDDRNVRMTFMGYLSYDGYNNNWLSNHSPAFVPFMKSQVDQILKANPDRLMFDTQTNSTRSTDMRTFGGDFNDYAMENFRVWLGKKYSSSELSAMGINNINTFNYRDFLLAQGVTHTSFTQAADTISGDVPMLEDFIYFNRDVWNQKFAEVLDYIRVQRPNIEIGASTHLFESRGYIFNENITFLSGELNLGARTTIAELPTNILVHLKGAQAVGKTLAYFPYPWEFDELRLTNSPRFGRGWVAQAYAYGGIFSIPANVWVGGDVFTWSPGADNYRDIYQFVRAQENLFNNYTSYSKVGLVHAMYSSMKAGFIDGGNQVQSSVKLLTLDNINFDMLVFGDEGHPVVPRSEDFDKFDHIFYDGDLSYLTVEQKAILDQQGSKVRHIGQRGTIAGIDINVSINGTLANETVSAVSRIHETNENAPYVVHLVNRPFAGGVTPTLNGVEVAIPQGYFPEDVTSATLHLPNGTSTNLTVSTNGNGDAAVTVNNLEVWGIIEFGH
ncbi:carbohydrate-binding protein [Colwellia sp. RE-S-Sl-9]